MSQGPLSPNLSQKVQKEVSKMANHNLSPVILLGGLSVNLNHLKKHVENFRIQVLKWSVPDAHPDSRVLSILKFSGIFENCMRGIFYSLKDTLLFKCSEFLIL